MAEPLSSASLYVRQGQDISRYAKDEIGRDIDPKQSAIFAIPTHVTTHAPGASDEDLAETHSESSSDIRLEGRPAPTAKSDALQAHKQLKAQQSVASSAPSTSSQNTVKAPPTVHRSKSVKQPQPPLASSSLRVEETPFPGLIANLTSAPPTYDANLFENQMELPPALPESAGPGRFPRWKGWLEKRALERHLERLDIAAAQGDAPVQRKKSWGAGVDDENALSDGEEQDDHESPPMTRGPLNLHHFGSRFISHLPSLPLCSAFLDLPPPPQSSRTGQRLLRRSIPEGVKRKVLLIGTSEGLFVAENRRRESKQDSLKRRLKADGKRREQIGSDWNGNIRCRKVWSGMGVYQMSILNSKANESESRSSRYSFSFLTSPPQDVSILLALCSSVKDSSKAPVVFASASTGASSSRDNLSPHVATSHFGFGNGGGPAKVSPPSGSGAVRMWSLEALRRVVAHTLDAEEPRVMDMLFNAMRTNGSADKKGKLARRIRKAWASLGEPSNERKTRRASRQVASQSMTDESADTTPVINQYRSKMSAEPEPLSPISHQRTSSADSDQFDEFGQVQSASAPWEDSGYDDILRLAQSSVLIKLPGNASSSSQQVNLGQGGSFTSLKSDEMGPTSTSGHASSTHSHAPAGKGVLFFSVFEASSEVGTTGTWYLALATAKSIYLYEAARPSNAGESRTWVFVKEYYTPMPPRGIAFTYSETNDTEETSRAPTPSRKHHHSQQSIPQAAFQHQVKSSPYSSVFRSHSDLTLFVSFGKRAILIRAGDASIKEVEMNLSDSEASGNNSSDAGHGKGYQQSAASAYKRRSLSTELLGGTEAGLGQWIGAEKIISQVIIRCKHHSPLDLPPLAASPNDRAGPTSRFDDGDDDDDDEEEEVIYNGLGVTLEDVPLPLQSTSPASPLFSRESTVVARATMEPAHILHAKVALLTKGVNSHLFPLPLSWDLHQKRPLGVFTWSDTPSAVMAWSKVIGLERDLSSGAISISSLGASRKKAEVGNEVTLHVKVTAVAFLSSRIELKRKKIKVVVKVPFVFNRDSELVLDPITKEQEGVAEDDDAEDESETTSEAAAAVEQELEYLCGLLSVTPKGYDVAKPWEAGSDAGAWAFDWRGASDYRLFFVSARV